MGGSNNPNNLVSLTVQEHAQAHKKLYEKYGKEEDRIAWTTLSGRVNKEELLRLRSKLGGNKVIRLNPHRKTSEFGRSQAFKLWATPGMKEHLIQKRVEQSATLGNPMQGKKQKRVTCICCRKEFAVNTAGKHWKQAL
jgi:hypothetical protein|tara:strand:- start:9 stop:422 length:414 start_codon:yes stop_codon:yes gene_type:complete